MIILNKLKNGIMRLNHVMNYGFRTDGAGLLHLIIGSAAAQASQILVPIFVSRNLGVDALGKYILAASTLQTFLVIASFGNQNAASRLTAIYQGVDEIRLSRLLGFLFYFTVLTSLTAVILMLSYAALMAGSSIQANAAFIPVVLIAPSLVFLAYDLYLKGIMIAKRETRNIAISSVIASICTTAFCLTASWWGDISYVCAALSASALTQCLVTRRATGLQPHCGGIRDHIASAEGWIVVRQYSLPTMLAGATVIPAHWLIQTSLLYYGGGYQTMASLGISVQWFTILMFVPVQFTKQLLPRLSAAEHTGDVTEVRRIIRSSFFAMFIYCFIALPLFFAGAPIISSIYSHETIELTQCLHIVAATLVITVLQSPMTAYITSRSNVWVSFRLNSIWAAMYITLSFLLRSYGAFGIMTSMFIAYLCNAVITYLWYQNHAKKS